MNIQLGIEDTTEPKICGLTPYPKYISEKHVNAKAVNVMPDTLTGNEVTC